MKEYATIFWEVFEMVFVKIIERTDPAKKNANLADPLSPLVFNRNSPPEQNKGGVYRLHPPTFPTKKDRVYRLHPRRSLQQRQNLPPPPADVPYYKDRVYRLHPPTFPTTKTECTTSSAPPFTRRCSLEQRQGLPPPPADVPKNKDRVYRFHRQRSIEQTEFTASTHRSLLQQWLRLPPLPANIYCNNDWVYRLYQPRFSIKWMGLPPLPVEVLYNNEWVYRLYQPRFSTTKTEFTAYTCRGSLQQWMSLPPLTT